MIARNYERRIAAVLIHFGIERRELKGWLFCSTPTGSKLAELQNNKRVPGKLEQQIRDAIARRKPDLVALDPFIKLHDLGENDSGDMNFVCGLLTRIAVESKIAVDVPHHIHKGQVVAGDADSGRGSSGIRDAGRLIFTLTIMSAAEAAELQHRTRSALQLRPPRQRQGEHRSPLRHRELVQARRRADRQRHARISRPATRSKSPSRGRRPTLGPGCRSPRSTPSSTISTPESATRTAKPTGERFSNAPAAKDRAVWPVVQRFAPDKSEAQCRTIIHQWLDHGVLVPEDYDSPEQRRKVPGLRVEAAKRPGTETET